MADEAISAPSAGWLPRFVPQLEHDLTCGRLSV
jgi:hypothetical protein